MQKLNSKIKSLVENFLKNNEVVLKEKAKKINIKNKKDLWDLTSEAISEIYEELDSLAEYAEEWWDAQDMIAKWIIKNAK